jgi:hypothetical protein
MHILMATHNILLVGLAPIGTHIIIITAIPASDVMIVRLTLLGVGHWGVCRTWLVLVAGHCVLM